MTIWTEEREALVAQAYNAGCSLKEVAVKLAEQVGAVIGSGAIAGKIRRLRRTTNLITRDKDPIFESVINWTPELEARLRELSAAQWSSKDIAMLMGVGESAVRAKRSALGIVVSPGPKRKVDLPNLTPITAARTAATADKIVIRQPKPTVWTEARCELVKQMFNAGRSDQDIADALDFDVTPSTVRRKRTDLGCKNPPARPRRVFYKSPELPQSAPAPETIEPRNISLLDLGKRDCRYPYGSGADVTFCGHPAAEGKSYCAHHQARCYTDLRAPAPVGGSKADRQFGDGRASRPAPASVGRTLGFNFLD